MRYAAVGDGTGQSDVVSYLMKDPDIQIDAKDLSGETPLQAAAVLGFEKVVNVLLRSEKIDVNNRTKNGMTVFDAAITGGNENVVAAVTFFYLFLFFFFFFPFFIHFISFIHVKLLLHPELEHDSKTLTKSIAYAPKAVEKLFDTCYNTKTGHRTFFFFHFHFSFSFHFIHFIFFLLNKYSFYYRWFTNFRI